MKIRPVGADFSMRTYGGRIDLTNLIVAFEILRTHLKPGEVCEAYSYVNLLFMVFRRFMLSFIPFTNGVFTAKPHGRSVCLSA